MRSSTCILALATLVLTSALAPALQKRVEKAKDKDFPALMESASAAWTSASWGECSKALSSAMSLATKKRMEAVIASFPPAGEGWTMKAKNNQDQAALAFSGISGTIVNADYNGPEGSRLSLTATIDSPVVQMMAMQFNNPKLLGADKELIQYENYKAILTKKNDTRHELTVLIGGSLLQANGNKMTADQLLAIMNEQAVTQIAKAISR